MMENEAILEEQVLKKGRHRKKQMYNSIMHQMEFYFSDSNLSKDKFLLPLVQSNPEVDISIFLKFNKIRKLTTNIDDIIKAINNSQLLELSEDKKKVRRKTPIDLKENVDNSTLYVERIKVDATHEWLSSVFSVFGNVTYVSIPKYRHNKANKGFAFVEFEKEQEALEALDYFETIGCRMSSLMAPEALCSITTYEGDKTDSRTNDDGKNDNNEIEREEVDETDTQKKRKHSTEENESNKKIKTDDGTTDSNNIEDNTQNNDYEGKKKKKLKKLRKKIFRELELQVLSKKEWKKIRNRYLDNQKAKMKQLKQFLFRNKFNNHIDTKEKMEQQSTKNSSQSMDTVDTKKEQIEDLEYIPGAIVKIKLPDFYSDSKKLKEELKQYSTEIKYVDAPTHASEGYLRFSDAKSAQEFCKSEYKGETVILEGKDEKEYWDKIKNDRSLKFKKNKKRLRGREKLLKKAEKELGKHIKFDDAD